MRAGSTASSPIDRVDLLGGARFAALAAIGAFWLVQSALVAIALLLLVVGVFHRESGPPRFEPTLLPAAFAGAFAGVRLGGWRGLLGMLVFASIPFARALSYPIGSAIECSRGNIDACRGATDFDFVLPQAWLLPGFVLGVLAARMSRVRVPVQAELEALACFALVQFVGYVVPMMQGYPTPSTAEVLVTSLGALAAAYIVATRAADPLRSALVVAGVLLLLVVPLIVFELWSNANPPWQATLWYRWLSFTGPVALVIATHALSMTGVARKAPRSQ